MKKVIIVLIVLAALLFFWFAPVVRITISGSGGLYNPGNKYGEYDDSFQSYSYITLKDYLFSVKIGY